MMIQQGLRLLSRTPQIVGLLHMAKLRTALTEHGLFDEGWYRRRYGCTDRDALRHFLRYGLGLGHDPHPLFDTGWYLRHNPDVAASGLPPLLHYLVYGGREGRLPHPLVAAPWLRATLPPGEQPFGNPLLGLLVNRRGIGPRPMIDVGRLAAALGLAADQPAGQVLSAWLSLPVADRPDPHPLFDAAWIRERQGLSPDADVLTRYCSDFGTTMSPHPLFDKDHVWRRNPAMHHLPGGLTLLDAALLADRPEEVDTTPLLDRRHYLAQLGAAGAGGVMPVLHYLSRGDAAGLDPNPLFDTGLYRARYGQAMEGRTALDHYARSGREHWVTLCPRFQDRFYTSRHPEVTEDYAGPALQHYLEFGRAENRSLGDPAWVDDFGSWDDLRADVRAEAHRLAITDPEVSVIIPVHGQFLYTLRCLWSILRAGNLARLQVILADDGSGDETQAFFADLPGVTYARNAQNIGFLRNCNAAARHATAPFLFFLNNDTAVLPGWIDSLLRVARDVPDAGIVGSKLVYPDGSLQEAGGVLWADGGGANLGRHADPEEPGYNLRRDADYISGAAILVPRPAWDDAGGFDEAYLPAYCEDSDLAMRLRNRGWRVIYDPASTVVHFEGASHGTSVETGIKAHQTVNFQRLAARWQFALARHAPARAIHPRRIPRPPRPRILVIDHIVPEPDRDAGSVIMAWHLRLLTDLGYEVTFLPCNLQRNGRYGDALRQMGVELLHAPYVRQIERYLDAHAADFDAFLLCRFAEGGAHVERLRTLCPATPVIFAPADLHFLRAARAARLTGSAVAEAEVQDIRRRELRVMELATETMLVSTHEQALLADMGVRHSTSVVPLVMEAATEIPPRQGRSGIAFVGGFRHRPNVDAVLHFVTRIWPLLRAADPGIEFHIVGSHPPPEIGSLTAPGLQVHGYVDDLEGFLGQRLVTVVPLTFGAGIKGKIGSSLAAGVPCVATSIGAEGMGLVHDRDILIADRPAEFAAAVLRLLREPQTWSRLSEAGLGFVRREYSPGVTRQRLLRLLAKAGVAPFAGLCALDGRAETRRFLFADRPDSLARGPEAPWSSDRVAAQALAALAGHPGLPLTRLAGRGGRTVGQLPQTSVLSGLAPLARILEDLGVLVPGARAEVAAACIPLDSGAEDSLDRILSLFGPRSGHLVLACPPVGMTPGSARAPAPILSRLARRLEGAGWQLRIDRLPLKECALTGCALIEARRDGGAG